MKVVYLIANIYRPGSGVIPPFFAGREKEIRVFQERLESTKRGLPSHLAIIGDYATGKTVLLKKFDELAAKDCFTYTCIAGAESTPEFFTSLIRGMSLKMKARFGETALKKLSGKISVSELSVSVFGTGGALKFESVGQAQLSFKEYLMQLWEEIGDKSKAIIIFLDDLDTAEDFRNTMMTLRNAVMELGDSCKVMIVVSGTERLYEKMHEAHAPLVRFFEPLELENLAPDEARKAIMEPAKNAGKEYDEAVVEKIVQYCAGQPYYLQEICYHIFEVSEGKRIGMAEFELGFDAAFSDIVKLMIERKVSGLSKSEMKLLSFFEPKKAMTFTDIVEVASGSKMKKSTATTSLNRLNKKGFVKKIGLGQDKGKYLVKDSMILIFLKKTASWNQ